MSAPRITVTICTYRRAALLATTLQSLDRARRPAEPWELLIVDNGCEDAVEQLVGQFASRLPVRYEREPTTGLAHARNHAVASARAPVMVCADDDVLFEPDWLVNMAANIAAHDDCAFWGGRILSQWNTPRPAWFDLQRCPMLQASIVHYDQGTESRYWVAESDPPFYGANLALRLDAVRQAGLFDPNLGHIGKKLGTGEDSWMIKSIHRAGGKGWYAADALVHHPVEERRLTKPFARRFAWRQGRISMEMLRREAGDQSGNSGPSDGRSKPGDGRVPRWVYRYALGQITSGCGRWLGGTLRGEPGLAFAGQYVMLFGASKLWSAMRRK